MIKYDHQFKHTNIYFNWHIVQDVEKTSYISEEFQYISLQVKRNLSLCRVVLFSITLLLQSTETSLKNSNCKTDAILLIF